MSDSVRLSMQCVRAVLCVSLLLSGILSESLGLTFTGREKRGWTLNSAGYLLGPHAHRTLTVKGELMGKRESVQENSLYSAHNDSDLHTLMEFISYLRLKELGTLDEDIIV
ncbi:galanin peptides-like [Amia ocellicauda]|uniref:galanin peptides-like n=1 Tax=Amia ocellicauda TaxID=2972642 RepID=UPI003464A7D0